MRIVVIAPHNDDEILGVGGTMARLVAEGHQVTVCEVTTGNANNPIVEAIKNEALEAHEMLGVDTVFMDLPVVGLREMPSVDLNAAFVESLSALDPDVVFIPHKGDMHIDHRMVVEAAMVALRPVTSPNLKAIYAYETLSETEWNIPTVENAFIPNVYIDISEYLDKKMEAMSCFQSQLQNPPHPRSLRSIEALASFRGGTVCRKYAEAFMCIRACL